MKVTVFTKPSGCGQCIFTKKHLKKKGIEFDEVVLDETWTELLKQHGFLGAPVVLVGDEDVWSGHSETEINALAEELFAA